LYIREYIATDRLLFVHKEKKMCSHGIHGVYMVVYVAKIAKQIIHVRTDMTHGLRYALSSWI
jgi:hypothetical protein